MERVKHGGEDWRERLRRATFRGAFFWVETDSFDGGRRVVIHEFPLKELPYNEDMGQQARRYHVDAYCVGGQADRQAVALIQACTSPGPATLVLPLFGSIRCRCLEITTRRDKDRHGFVGFRLTFVADVLTLSSLGGSPHIAQKIKGKAEQLPAALRNVFKDNYFAADVPDFVLSSAVSFTQEWVAEVQTVGSQSEMRGESASEFDRKAQQLFDAAPDLLAVGYSGDIWGYTHFATAAVSEDPTLFVNAVTDLMQTYGRAAGSAHLAVEGYIQLLNFALDRPPLTPATANRQREKDNQDSLLWLFQHSSIAQLAVAVTNDVYPSRREAIAARAMIAEKFNSLLEATNDPAAWEVLLAMRDLQGMTVDFLSKLITDLAPVLMLQAQTRMPALYWAYRLYADGKRTDDLWLRNRIKHPAWMPTEFEALTR